MFHFRPNEDGCLHHLAHRVLPSVCTIPIVPGGSVIERFARLSIRPTVFTTENLS